MKHGRKVAEAEAAIKNEADDGLDGSFAFALYEAPEAPGWSDGAKFDLACVEFDSGLPLRERGPSRRVRLQLRWFGGVA